MSTSTSPAPHNPAPGENTPSIDYGSPSTAIPIIHDLDPATDSALSDNLDQPRPRSRRWLAVLILPARAAVAFLSFKAGTTLTIHSMRHPLSIVTGLATVAASHILINFAIRAARRRAERERELAEAARTDRVNWLDAVQAIGKIVDRFKSCLVGPDNFKSARCVFLDISLARLLHSSTLSRRIALARCRPSTRDDVLESGRHYLEFALATYGFILLKFSGIMHPGYDPMRQGSRGQDVARYMLNLRDEDFVVSQLDGEEINVPRYFVAMDHAHRSIVVAIRGTNSISDIITDLICENEPFAGGYAHAGMKSSAETLLASLVPKLRQVADEHPRYGIVVTGHSLGAGVAMLLTKLVLMTGFTDVKCYAFAPPPVFGPMHKVDSDWSDALECFVNADDLVSTLCLASARRMALEVERIDKKLELSVAQKRDLVNQNRGAEVEDLLNRSRVSAPDPREEEVEQLYIPTHRGVHWLVGESDDVDEYNVTNQKKARSEGNRSSASEGTTGSSPLSHRTDNDNNAKSPGTSALSPEKRRALEERRRKWKRQVFDLRGKVPPAYVPSKQYKSFIVRPRFFEKILVTPNCVGAHFPNSYAAAFAGLGLEPREFVTPPSSGTKFTTVWYDNELG